MMMRMVERMSVVFVIMVDYCVANDIAELWVRSILLGLTVADLGNWAMGVN